MKQVADYKERIVSGDAASIGNFRDNILNFVQKMKTGAALFRMNEGAGGTIYTSCFALFIFDLFGEVNKWTLEEKGKWINHINSFQDRETGYFIPENYKGDLGGKPVQQLTCFCLSALDILGSSPLYDFSFLKQWPGPEDVHGYLNGIGCFKGKPSTGNMAMFLAIFLTYQYERCHDKPAKDCLDAWFRCHDKSQNKSTGFWGDPGADRHYTGFQNAFHQYVVYNYWKRKVPCYEKIVDNVLSLQDHDGHFGPVPGGGGCWDFDAADILINRGYKNGYRRKEIGNALTHLYFAILKNQNDDGGFCESRKRPASPASVFKMDNLKFVFRADSPLLFKHRLKAMLSVSRKKREKILTHWTSEGRFWGQSDLWNTWFRCLTLAEILNTIEIDHFLADYKWNFHKFIGLGYFENCRADGKQ